MTQSQALYILKTGVNVFLTGEPGSGKTHLINEYIKYLRYHSIEPAITASTGIAATHIGGMTVHSWSGIGIKTKLEKSDLNQIKTSQYIVKRITKTKVLIIEEISMLTGDTLSMVDTVCREIKQNSKPFGGIQVILAGDFFQLPPVVRREVNENTQTMLLEKPSTVFAFDSPSWKELNPVVCYLTEQHRQEDGDFLELLSAIHGNVFNKNHLSHIETRRVRSFDFAQDKSLKDIPKLFSHNADVDRINNQVLASLPGKQNTFIISVHGPDPLVAALKKGCLSPEILYLKVGASVMFTKNNPKGGFVNGTLGVVDSFDKISGNPIVKIRSGRLIEVESMVWTIEENGKVRASISQLPLRLAWAITVHKSQGMSLDEAVMDLSQVFEFGQGYVALSRVRRLSGLYLLGFNARTFQVHPEILAKDESFRFLSDEASNGFEKISKEEILKMHNNFITACDGEFVGVTKKENEIFGNSKLRKKSKISTYDETLSTLKEGGSLKDISKKRGLTESTIISHVEKLHEEKKISDKDIEKMISNKTSKAIPEIKKEFKKNDDGKLTPVFEKFKGKY